MLFIREGEGRFKGISMWEDSLMLKQQLVILGK